MVPAQGIDFHLQHVGGHPHLPATTKLGGLIAHRWSGGRLGLYCPGYLRDIRRPVLPIHSVRSRVQAARREPSVGGWDRSRAATHPTAETTRRTTQRAGSCGSVRLPSCVSLCRRPCSFAAHPATCALPRPCQHASESVRIHRLRTGSGDHYNIEARQASGIVTEALTDLALEAVTRHGVSGNATRDREPKPGMFGAVGPHDECHDLRVQAETAGKDRVEISPSPQPLLRPEPPIGGLAIRPRVCAVPSHAVR